VTAVPFFTVVVQRSNATQTAWETIGVPHIIESDDAVDAAIRGLRDLRVLPKIERLLLWEGREMSGRRRIFHSGS
jgi:hypothetical protein